MVGQAGFSNNQAIFPKHFDKKTDSLVKFLVIKILSVESETDIFE